MSTALALALLGAGACGGGSTGVNGSGGSGPALGSAGDPGSGGTAAGTGGGSATGGSGGGGGAPSGTGGSTGGTGGAIIGPGGTPTGGMPGTGGAISGTGGAAGAPVTSAHPPWTELGAAVVDVQGGTALSAGGVGQNGGVVHLLAGGEIWFDPSQPGVSAQSVPAVPAGAMTIASASLAADVTVNGSATFEANATTGGTDAVRKVVVGGDLFVTGTLRSADLSAARQGLTLQASGTIYVSGTVDTSGAAGTGQAGGAIQMIANQVIITGHVVSAGGGSDSTGGPAGAVTIRTSKGVFVTGTVDTSGGNVVAAGSVAGGAAGTFKIQAGGDVGLSGIVLTRGGGASSSGAGPAQGGAAASLVIDANGAVTIGGVVDGRGGLAGASSAGGASVKGGAAGNVRVGEYAAPTSVAIVVPLVATGGDGGASAGTGGTLTPEPGTGSINVAGAHEIDLSGGNSMSAPGAGGVISGSPRKDPGTGGVHVTGDITLNGGSIVPGGSGNGADGGTMKITVIPTDGPVLIDQSANIVANGGKSGGTGTAGGGGHIWFWTMDGDITCAGHVTTNGGDAPDAGGKGGLSGMIYFFSDDNHNAVEVPKGNLLITSTGVLTSNGGNGTTGGDSRNYGMPGTVAPFGDGDAAMTQEQIAILLNCDGEHGNTNNWMENDGWLYADGGMHNGRGGDIVYHGIPPNARQDPNFDSYGDYPVPSGNIQNKGDGTGLNGTFAGE